MGALGTSNIHILLHEMVRSPPPPQQTHPCAAVSGRVLFRLLTFQQGHTYALDDCKPLPD